MLFRELVKSQNSPGLLGHEGSGFRMLNLVLEIVNFPQLVTINPMLTE